MHSGRKVFVVKKLRSFSSLSCHRTRGVIAMPGVYLAPATVWLLVANRPGGSSSPVKDAVAMVAAETVAYRYILYFIYLLAAFEHSVRGCQSDKTC